MPIDLSEVRRESVCCRAPVTHTQLSRAKFKIIKESDSVFCLACGKPADDFEVISRDGTRIWPLDDDDPLPVIRNWNDLTRLFTH